MGKKYLKVMFGNKGANYEYKIDEINISNDWNPSAKSGKDFGGFNFSTEDKIIRWLVRGDTLYDIIIPKDAEVIDVIDSATLHGVFRSNKIIPTNPRKVTDEMALEFYIKSNIPKIAYYKAMAGCSVMGYEKTARQIFLDKVNIDNIDEVIKEWNDFINKKDRKDCNNVAKFISEALEEIKSDLLISLNVDKTPYIKQITNDNVINITGESGSGKSTYIANNFNNDDYIVIDTDELFKRNHTATGINKELGNWFKEKYNDSLDTCKDFNIIYGEILKYFKNTNKTIVIDSAQFRNLETDDDLKILKGKIVILRICVNKCVERRISRWKKKKVDYTKEELDNYIKRTQNLYIWYKRLNTFIQRIDEL